MNDSPYSDTLIEWAAMAGLSLSFYDGIWVLADLGGEIRYYLHSTDVHTLTQAERGDPESFLVSAVNITDIERYLMNSWESTIRYRRSLPYISSDPLPLQACDIAPGYSLREVEPGKAAIVSSDGTVRVIIRGDTTSTAFIPVWFSYILDASLKDLRASFLDPDGLPLFPGCKIGPSRTS